MARIKAKDTQPELRVRRTAHAMGYRFRLHQKKLPGCPDLVFPARKAVIFVHGCFWHMHQGCPDGRLPRSRQDYWRPKLEGNVERDGRKRAALEQLGWRVLTIWECETKSVDGLKPALRSFIDGSGTVVEAEQP